MKREQHYLIRGAVRRRAKRQLLRWLAGLGVVLVLVVVLGLITFSAGPVLGRRAAVIPTPDFTRPLIYISVNPYTLPR